MNTSIVTKQMKRLATFVIGLGVVMAGPIGCATKTQTGLLIGGAGGAAVGGAIGSGSGNAGKGALIGGAIGLIGGGLIGHAADKSDEAEASKQKAREAEARAERRYAPPSRSASQARITQQDVIDWSDKGTGDDVIIDRIERSDTVFRLTSADESRLRDYAVSEPVIRAMKATGGYGSARD